MSALTELADELLRRQQRLALAESCTGGLVAAACTDLPGSSRWFDRGFVTYSNAAKEQLLDVSPILLAQHGAVSAQTVAAMCGGVLHHSEADWVAAVSGIAGPDGGSPEKPIGTVWFAVQHRGAEAQTFCFYFVGDRTGVRTQAVACCLKLINDCLRAA